MSRPTRVPFVLDGVEEFLRTKAARQPKTQMAYSSVLLGSERGTKPALGVPLAPYFYNRRFKTITHDEIAGWFAQRVRGGSQSTKHRVSKNARQFLRFARERGYTVLDLDTAIDAFSQGGPRIDWLEWGEIHALIAAIPEFRYRFAASWLFWTGCRVAEGCGALQQDVRWRAEADMYQWSIPDTKTHVPRTVWLPEQLKVMLEQSRQQNQPGPNWPLLWDCAGLGFGRSENPAHAITPRTINSALERGREAISLPVKVTAHLAKHSYCSNWIKEQGKNEYSMEKLSRQVGTSVSVLRKTYVHIDLSNEDWQSLKSFGATSS